MAIRVLLLTSEFPPDLGGIASHVAELAKALPAGLADVRVVHPRNMWGPEPHSEADTVPVRRPGLIKGEPIYQLMLHRWLRRELARRPADILHVHGMRPLAATRGLSAKTVFTNHSSGFLARLNAAPGRKRQTARLLRHIVYLIGPSDELVEAARAFDFRGPAAMIPNGVDTGRFSPGASPLRHEWGIAANEKVILLARRLVDKNGVTDLARAACLLARSGWRLVIAGEGPERSKMTAIFRGAGILDRVLFLGAVANSAMPSIYRAADVSVLPSHAEATSIAGLEAMASGLPLVGTRVGGIPTIIADEDTGILVERGDVEAMAAALGRLLSDEALRARFGASARVRAIDAFSWPVIAEKTLNIYRECLAAHPQGRRCADEVHMPLLGHKSQEPKATR